MPSFAALGNDLYTGRRSFDFVRRWRRLLALGAILVVASVLVVAVKGLNPGIEFRGGSEYRISDVATTAEQPGLDAVAEVVPDAEPPVVTVIGGSSVRVQTERLDDAQTTAVGDALAEAYGVDRGEVTSSFVGPVWGDAITRQALIGLFVFLAIVTVVITVYFRDVAMAMAAMVALVHDLAITVGVYALVGFEVTPASVIGFLTILGFSLYDTVVVFDKVREQTAGVLEGRARTYLEQVNLAVNQTVVRSINTSVVAVLPIASILFIGALLLGAGTLRDVSLALFVGTLVGAYSSLFVAPAFLALLKGRDRAVTAHDVLVAEHRALEASGGTDGAAAAGDVPVTAGATPVGRDAGAAARAADDERRA